MSEKPFFSLIFVLLEDKRFLSVSLDSICKQTFSSYEVLIMAKTLTEEEKKLFSYYKKMPISIYLEDQAYLGKTLNLGLEKAKGSYVQFFLQGDLYLWPKALEEIHEILVSEKPDLFCSASLIRKDRYPKAVSSEVFIEGLKNGTMRAHINTMLFEKSLFSRFFRFNEAIKHYPGFDFLIKILRNPSVKVFLGKKVYVDQDLEANIRNYHFREQLDKCRIIFTHFGWKKAIHFAFRLMGDFIRTAFRKAKAVFRSI